MFGRLVASVLAVSLLLPSNIALAQPVQSDRDLDGVSDDTDSCPDVYGAPPSGCPPQQPPPPDRDYDGVRDDLDACPDQGAPTSSGCPDAPPPVETPPVDVPPSLEVDPSDEYQTLLRTLPNDYDLQYTFDAPARKRKKENDPGVAAKRLRGLGIAGSSLVLVGAVGLITTLSTGLVMAKNAKDDLEATNDEFAPGGDPSGVMAARQDAIDKGERGDKVAIIGSAAGGGLMALGAALLLGARSLRKKTYGAPSGGGGGGGSMNDKTKRNLTIYGALLVLYGLIFIGAGAVLAKRDDPEKAKNGKIVLGIGGAMAGLGVLLFIPLLINKTRKTSRINAGPMWVRGGAGAGVRVNF